MAERREKQRNAEGRQTIEQAFATAAAKQAKTVTTFSQQPAWSTHVAAVRDTLNRLEFFAAPTAVSCRARLVPQPPLNCEPIIVCKEQAGAS